MVEEDTTRRDKKEGVTRLGTKKRIFFEIMIQFGILNKMKMECNSSNLIGMKKTKYTSTLFFS